MVKIYIEKKNKKLYKQDNENNTIELIQLNRSEFLILTYLTQNPDVITSRQTLIENGWPGRFVSENSLNVTMMKLRRKIEVLNHFIQIETCPGEGYRLSLFEPETIEFRDDDKFLRPQEDEKSLQVEHEEEVTKNRLESREAKKFGHTYTTIEKMKKHSSIYMYNLLETLSKPRLQILLFILFCFISFTYFYSESWTPFVCIQESLCIDQLG